MESYHKKHRLPADLDSLLERVNKPNASQEDVEEFREVLKQCLPDKLSNTGNLADQIKNSMIDRMPAVPMLKEFVRFHTETIKTKLGWENSTPLERLIIESIVNSWINYHSITGTLTSFTSVAYSLQAGEHLEKRVNHAQKRFFRAIESLMRVRKMMRFVPVNDGLFDITDAQSLLM